MISAGESTYVAPKEQFLLAATDRIKLSGKKDRSGT